MGHRLSKIYTRTGDNGTTGLGDGSRVSKDSGRIELIGTVDEANAYVGVLIAECSDSSVLECLTTIQHHLFNLGGELAVPGMTLIDAEAVTFLESQIDSFNADLPMLKEFILPGGNRMAASAHVVRAVLRRGERQAVALHRVEPLSEPLRQYLNRASDLMFVIARHLARVNGGSEVLWQNPNK